MIAYLSGIPWREDNQDDLDAVERHQVGSTHLQGFHADHQAYQIGIFAEPIYNTGVSVLGMLIIQADAQDWPELIKNDLPPEILPRFTQDEIDMIKCSADFFAIDVGRLIRVHEVY